MKIVFLGSTKFSEELLSVLIKNNFVDLQSIATINNQIIKILNSKLTQLKVENNKSGKIAFIDDKVLVATSDYFLEIGLVDNGNEIQQFKDYARVNNLWGGYSRAKNLRMVAWITKYFI